MFINDIILALAKYVEDEFDIRVTNMNLILGLHRHEITRYMV